MTAVRHVSDATDEAKRLAGDIEMLIGAARHGLPATIEHLEHLRRAAAAVFYHCARAAHDLQRMPAEDRRHDGATLHDLHRQPQLTQEQR